jgi:hypothetical protein
MSIMKKCRNVDVEDKDSATPSMAQWMEQSVKTSEIIESDLVSGISLLTLDTSLVGEVLRTSNH